MKKIPFSKSARVLWLLMTATVLGLSAQVPARTYPFTAEENADGARFVWYVYSQTGFPYDYLPAKLLPTSKNFRPAPGDKPQMGDVAWWKDYVAIYAGDDAAPDANILMAHKKAGLKEMEKQHGPVKWYRYWKDD